jgi:hypothetical protein
VRQPARRRGRRAERDGGEQDRNDFQQGLAHRRLLSFAATPLDLQPSSSIGRSASARERQSNFACPSMYADVERGQDQFLR